MEHGKMPGLRLLQFDSTWPAFSDDIINPSFDSQCKNVLTNEEGEIGRCVFTEDDINRLKNSEIFDTIMTWASEQEKKELSKITKKTTSNLKSIEKLEDANEAGSKE